MTWEYPLLDDGMSPLPVSGSKPFSTGCIATSNDWSELVQVGRGSAVLWGSARFESLVMNAGLFVLIELEGVSVIWITC